MVDAILGTRAQRIFKSGDLIQWGNKRTNTLLYSQDIDNAAWAKTGIASTTANAAVAPDGTMTADRLIEDTSNGTHHWDLAPPPVALPGLFYTVSCHVKQAVGSRWFAFQMNAVGGVTASVFLYFDFTTVVASPPNHFVPGFTGVSGAIQSLGNGWLRCSMTVGTHAGTSAIRPIHMINNAGSRIYVGDGASGLYVWGSQFEAGSVATPYIPTSSVPVTRP